MFALDNAQRLLAQELMRMRELTEVGLRLRRQLIDDLLEGTDEASAYARAEAVGHDLQHTHYVVVVHWPGNAADISFTRAVEQVTATSAPRPLITRRGDRVVLLTEARHDDDAVYAAPAHELGTPDGAIGVSTRCDSPGGVPHCYQEALRALEVRQNSRQSSGTTFFDELGLYRILGPGNSLRELEGFVREWLGQLIDYDAGHDTELVETLSRYFDCGGNYDDAAAALTVHRSTLRYRLQRIREISDRDLADVGPAQSAGGNARLEDHPGQAALTAATRRAGAAGQPGCQSPPTHVLERCYPCVRGLPPTSPCARGLTGWERRHCAPGQ
ncbi:PucR family transcriptional regulator [Streptomyces avermitilis]|uniref:PucR family transcriptional regulator n=1 Tax=Streptomyces avermitilis TaxID=33903 RepID=UPI0038212F9F